MRVQKRTVGEFWRETLSEAAAFLATALLVLAFYAPRALPHASFVLGDSLEQNVPHRVYAARVISEGRLPHWSDATFGGYPFLSDPQTAVFFPPFFVVELLGWVPDTSWRFDALALSFVLVSALAMTGLSRALVLARIGAIAAGVFFGLNGYMVNHLSHTVITSAIAAGVLGMWCLAVALLRNSTRAWWAAVLCFASSVLAGHWQTAMFAWQAAFAGGVYLALRQGWLHRSWRVAGLGLAKLAAVFALAGCATLVQVLPTLEFLKHSTRHKVSWQDAVAYSLPLKQLAGLLMPGLYQPLFWRVPESNRWELCWNTWGIDGAWEFHFWMGLVAFALILFGFLATSRRISSWLLVGCLAFTLVASMGQDFGLYRWIYAHVPGFRQVRIPPRMLWVGYVAGALLIARALTAMSQLPRWPWRRIASAGTLLGLAALGIVALYFIGWALMLTDGWTSALELLLVINPNYRISMHRSEAEFLGDLQSQAWVGGATLFLLAVWLWAAGRARKPSPMLAATALLLMWGELGVYGIFKNIRTDSLGFSSAVTPMHALIDFPVTGRLHCLQPGPWEKNTGEASGVAMTTGYNPMILQWVAHHNPPEASSHGLRSHENLLDAWNASHVAAPGARCVVTLPDPPSRVELTTGTGAVYLSRGHQDLRSSITVETKAKELRALAIISGAMGVAGEAEGTTVGRVRLYSKEGDELTSFPLRLGMETAEWMYDQLETRPKHSAPMRAFVSHEDLCSSPPTYFLAYFNVETSKPVERVCVESELDSPRWLAVSHVVEITTGGTAIEHPAVEGIGYSAAPSRNPNVWIYFARPSPPGWAWLVPEAKPVSYKSNYRWVRERLADPTWNPRTTVWVDKAMFSAAEDVTTRNASAPENFRGAVEVLHPTPEQWLIRTDASDQGWLVISKTWYPGWTATLDGAPVNVVRANGCFSAVAVPEGRHTVELHYGTPWLWLGAAISAPLWILALFGVSFGVPRWPRSHED
jgi:hypothetical protein